MVYNKKKSTIVEEDNNENEEVNSNNYIFFSINDTSIITFQELAKKNPLGNKLILNKVN